MKRAGSLIVASAAAALLGGCADFREPIGAGGTAPARPLSPEEARYQALEERLADLNRRVQNLNLAALSQDNARLEAEVRGLRGEVERLTYLVETAEKRSKEIYADLDRRLVALENERRAARLAMDPTLAGAPPPTVAASPEEESAYLQAFDQLKAGRYDEAITGFRSLLERFPKGRYADNAWYWLGESYYVKRNFPSAEASFRSLLQDFPASGKRADALFKLGMTQLELKRPQEARATLERVVEEHPGTNAATLARQRLQELR